MAKAKSQKLAEELTYEEALVELEGIVAALEEGENPLEEAIQLFERGQALVKRCGALLESAQLKVQKLVGETLEDFEEESE
ncbi:MAG: exodeoxyribonuclease VII small subunit [Anaerolineales bacterium]|nr:exodeoxyribonuclease VII small subunit [Anaerolineales bacterium]